MAKYTGQETWLKRLAGVTRSIFRLDGNEPPESEIIFDEEATDSKAHSIAMNRFLEHVELPAEGLNEFHRLQRNRDLYERMLSSARMGLRVHYFRALSWDYFVNRGA